ncbi:Phage virion morphogenesis family protein [compost metagenome]
MSFNLSLTWDDLGIRRLADGLAALHADLRTEVLAPVGMALESTTIERFDTNVGPDGQAWEPSFRASITGGRTLVDKGHLRDSVHHIVEDDAVEIGSAHISAGVHQFGATIHAKTSAGLNFTLADGLGVTVDTVTIPERPFVGMSIEDGSIVVGIAEDALVRAKGGVA